MTGMVALGHEAATEQGREATRRAHRWGLYDAFGQAQGGQLDASSVLRDSSTRLIVYSWNTEPGLIDQNLTSGAHGYVSKTVDAEALVEAIERVHRGETVVSVPEWKPGEGRHAPLRRRIWSNATATGRVGNRVWSSTIAPVPSSAPARPKFWR